MAAAISGRIKTAGRNLEDLMRVSGGKKEGSPKLDQF
jgi:hypothetical protein